MPRPLQTALTRRERQIMDILYRLGKATVADVLAEFEDQPSYSTVRAQLRVLEEKGHVRHEDDGARYVYLPTLPRNRVRQSALWHVVETFFEGSTEQVVATLLGPGASRLSPEELERLAAMIENARKDGKS
jgi:predicted transcriptional regulator